MATKYGTRLQKLRARRLGLDSPLTAFRDATEYAQALTKSELYEKRATTEALQYALGAMQEVDPGYTKTSFEEGERVRAQLEDGLPGEGVRVQFDYQGSVPLNIHVRRMSDIDLLVLHDQFLVYDRSGARAHLYTPMNVDVLDRMQYLRRACEIVLRRRFYGAIVDSSGSKAITLSGGAFRRNIDVVPAHWDDTATYQTTLAKHDRQIWVLDKDVPATIANRPFMHIKKINDKDAETAGNTKKVIRLLKTLRRDSDLDIELSSYDIASLVWHFTRDSMNQPVYLEATLIAVAQAHVHFFLSDRPYAETLVVPDGSRRIFDSNKKFEELRKLSDELDDLAANIAAELRPSITRNADQIQKVLLEARID